MSETFKRKHVRYAPDPLEVAFLDTDPKRATFSPSYTGLIIELSGMGGCCLGLLKPKNLQTGQQVKLKIGKLEPLLSEVRWLRPQEKNVVFVGFKFLE